jgi:hypothetical protein
MSEQIITSDKSILNRIGHNHKPLIPEPETPTPKICSVCLKQMFPRLLNRRIIYIHQCQARLKTGKAISRKLKY